MWFCYISSVVESSKWKINNSEHLARAPALILLLSFFFIADCRQIPAYLGSCFPLLKPFLPQNNHREMVTFSSCWLTIWNDCNYIQHLSMIFTSFPHTNIILQKLATHVLRLTILILFSFYVNSVLKRFHQFRSISLMQVTKKPDCNI